MNKIIIDYKTREKRYALIENDLVTKLNIQQPQEETMVGNIYIGIVEKVVNGLHAAFIDIGEGKKGYLHRDQIPAFIHAGTPNKEMMPLSKFIHQGEKILVQVKKDETDAKGPLLSALLEFPAPKLVYIPRGKYIAVSKKGSDELRQKWRNFGFRIQREEEGFLFRTESFTSSEEVLETEIYRLREEYEQLMRSSMHNAAPSLLQKPDTFIEEVERDMNRLKAGDVITDDSYVLKRLRSSTQSGNWRFEQYYGKQNIFDHYDIEKEFTAALKKVIWLENGAYLVIERTEAMTVIDVNTGKFTGKSNLKDTVYETNKLAALEAARQIILRDYSGIILIDFIDMNSETERQNITDEMNRAMKKDPKYFRIMGFTSLGILQLTRKKTKKSIPDYLTDDCPACLGTGMVKSAETIAFQLERLLWERPFDVHEAVLIETTSKVKKVFSGENDSHLKRLQDQLNVKLYFQLVKGPVHFFELKQFGTEEEIKKKTGSIL
ncbi:Rne/Rng family ribonuclease [Falsibacillus albus]|uniref:Ribonuclease E/G n=1 Tax=Falsibacillus albus TaxID=2478915 RepID=A0A3L7K4Q8_9BACI|nr:ribonuclease E/G [Falsibacillus albus]RLQ98066.1 ribonuclease E/G [Falsibacillus albus]